MHLSGIDFINSIYNIWNTRIFYGLMMNTNVSRSTHILPVYQTQFIQLIAIRNKNKKDDNFIDSSKTSEMQWLYEFTVNTNTTDYHQHMVLQRDCHIIQQLEALGECKPPWRR